MRVKIMKSNIARQRLLKEVQEAFTKAYPYLRIDFTRGRDGRAVRTLSSSGDADAAASLLPPDEQEVVRSVAEKLLWGELGLSDDTKINEVEVLLQYEFGLPAQVLRKSGNLWLETRMTQHWTLRQQNDHGYEIAQGFR